MNLRTNLIAVTLTTCSALALGCEHHDETAMNPPDNHITNVQPTNGNAVSGVTSRQGPSMDATIDRLTTARCDREEACGNIGDGKRYATRQVCTDQMRGGIANDLTASDCPAGLDGSKVKECMSAIGNEQCGLHPIESMSRIEKCRTSALCPR
jgi:hypothetical protein